MGEDPESLTTGRGPALIERRGILLMMSAILGLAVVIAGISQGVHFAFGVLFGGVLAFVNYLWLDRSTKAIFTSEIGRSTGLLAAKYILRYAVIGGILLLIYLTGVLPVVAVILGLSIFALAVVAAGLRSIFSNSL